MKNDIVIDMLADLWTNDIIDLVCKGKHKEAISVGVKMGLTKKYIKQIIKDYKNK
tara:strand:- start:639 stop:803 length:165 start_codon:yes stop_codon:yes gene_type:complete